ncbi:hypothetical protein GE061_008731 [Apolygus lucorum]|uniref:Uncharacterized protein n=1 Tax=Apolygus lucorum TaxID=248454 RepID=A0A8S9WQS3_APOLU|nr:hypothetical protein GE061_008731 [Apolygus lucorum]
MEDGIVVKEEPMSEGDEDQVMGELVLIKQEVLIGDDYVEEEVGNSRADEDAGCPMIKQEDSSAADPLYDESDVLQGSTGVQRSEARPALGTEEDEKLKPLKDDVAIDISDKNTKRSKGGEKRETGLLLHDFESVPESRTAAKRLRTLERKMDRDSEFADENCAEMNECFDKGNARVLSTEEGDRVMETIPSELTAKSCSEWCQCENVKVLDWRHD